MFVGEADVVTNVAEGEAVVGVGEEESVKAPEVGALPEYAWVVVNGVIAVDSEEMSEESAERRDGAAVVSNVRLLNGRPLVLWKKLGKPKCAGVGVRTQVHRWAGPRATQRRAPRRGRSALPRSQASWALVESAAGVSGYIHARNLLRNHAINGR